jgi:hypothetical protein
MTQEHGWWQGCCANFMHYDLGRNSPRVKWLHGLDQSPLVH